MTTTQSEYEKIRDRSLNAVDLQQIIAVMKNLEKVEVFSGSVVVDYDGTPIAEVWWCAEEEQWKADFDPEAVRKAAER